MQLKSPGRKVLWSFLCKLLKQQLQRGIRAFVRYTRLETYSRVIVARRIERYLQRQVDIGIFPRKPWRRDSYNCVVLAHQLQGLSDHRVIRIEVPLPELIAQHDDRLRILPVDRIGRKQTAPKKRGHTEKVKGIRTEIRSLYIFRNIVPRHCEAPPVFDE